MIDDNVKYLEEIESVGVCHGILFGDWPWTKNNWGKSMRATKARNHLRCNASSWSEITLEMLKELKETPLE
jgi:hypothetical protein